MKFKKYILFGFDQYYPAGGLGDIVDSFDTLEDAQAKGTKGRYDENYIVDRDTWQIVWG